MKLLVLTLLPLATALRLPTVHLRPVAAAATLASPALPAIAYENGHKLIEGTAYGDVVAPLSATSENYALSAFIALVALGGVRASHAPQDLTETVLYCPWTY